MAGQLAGSSSSEPDLLITAVDICHQDASPEASHSPKPPKTDDRTAPNERPARLINPRIPIPSSVVLPEAVARYRSVLPDFRHVHQLPSQFPSGPSVLNVLMWPVDWDSSSRHIKVRGSQRLLTSWKVWSMSVTKRLDPVWSISLSCSTFSKSGGSSMRQQIWP